jgi:hypothetical protein
MENSDKDNIKTGDQNRKKCESIFFNILECHRRNGDQNILATSYLREFSETARCDEYHDFSSLREDIIKRLGPETLDRIEKYEETEKDLSVATQVCLHYHRWHEKHLLGALTWSQWIQYQTFDRAERTFAAIGIFTAGYSGMKFLSHSFRIVRENIKKKK